MASPETGYYGIPLLKEPSWTWEIPLYFFVGGAAGAAAVVGAIADYTGADRKLVRDARWIAAAGAVLSPGAAYFRSGTARAISEHDAGVQTTKSDVGRSVDFAGILWRRYGSCVCRFHAGSLRAFTTHSGAGKRGAGGVTRLRTSLLQLHRSADRGDGHSGVE